MILVIKIIFLNFLEKIFWVLFLIESFLKNFSTSFEIKNTNTNKIKKINKKEIVKIDIVPKIAPPHQTKNIVKTVDK